MICHLEHKHSPTHEPLCLVWFFFKFAVDLLDISTESQLFHSSSMQDSGYAWSSGHGRRKMYTRSDPELKKQTLCYLTTIFFNSRSSGVLYLCSLNCRTKEERNVSAHPEWASKKKWLSGTAPCDDNKWLSCVTWLLNTSTYHPVVQCITLLPIQISLWCYLSLPLQDSPDMYTGSNVATVPLTYKIVCVLLAPLLYIQHPELYTPNIKQ